MLRRARFPTRAKAAAKVLEERILRELRELDMNKGPLFHRLYRA